MNTLIALKGKANVGNKSMTIKKVYALLRERYPGHVIEFEKLRADIQVVMEGWGLKASYAPPCGQSLFLR